MQVGVNIGSYTFDASARTVTFNGVALTSIFQIKPIINGSTQKVIFNPAEGGSFGVLAGNVLTLDYDTSTDGSADTNDLYICVNIPNSVSVIDEGVTTVKTGQGFLERVIIAPTNKKCTVEVYDNTSANGTLIGVFRTDKEDGKEFNLDVKFSTGITFDVSNDGSPEVTVIYK